MVRLKREIEGVRQHHGVPPPSYALDPLASAELLPGLDEWLRTREPAQPGQPTHALRVLLAGVPRLDLAIDLARDGHWVTVSDLDSEQIAGLHAGLDAKVASRLTLVDRVYGEASFAPSSFDLILLADALHAYREPQWLVHKAQRELKPDALLAVRALVQGPLPTLPQGTRAPMPATGAQALAERVAERLLRRTGGILRSPLGAVLAEPRAREALDRGAHLQADRFAPPAEAVLQAVAAVLKVEDVRVGHTLRLALADALFGVRHPWRQALLRALRAVPEEANDLDRLRTGPRVLGLVARRALTLRTSAIL